MLPKPVPQDSPTLSLEACAALSADELALQMAAGGLTVTVDGALSEWGSRVDDLLHKLEHSVLKWRSDGDTKTLLLRFVETAPKPGEEGVITFKAD